MAPSPSLIPLASISADPILNPRTLRTSADEEAKINLFCPVPQMVGGGTVHWQGWLPRFTEADFRLRSVVGDVPGATLVDWPISYADLEPYYTCFGPSVTSLNIAFLICHWAGIGTYFGIIPIQLSLETRFRM